MTRLLAIGDTHGEFDRFAVGSLPDADLALVAGDLTDCGMREPRQVGGAERWVRDLADRYRTVFYVLGNHDLDLGSNHFDRHEGREGHEGHIGREPGLACRTIERRIATHGGLSFVGASLSPCFDLPELAQVWQRMTADPEADRLYFATLPEADVVLSHCPPYGILDEGKERGSGRHLGSPGLLSYMKVSQPRLVVCGHIHEAAGTEVIDWPSVPVPTGSSAAARGTPVVNCARRSVLVTLGEGGATLAVTAEPWAVDEE